MNNNLVGVCHPNWRGIKAATYSLTPLVVEIAEINSLAEAENYAEEIIKYQPQKVILSGYPSGYDLLAEAIKKKSPTVRIFFLSHASFTWYGDRLKEVSWLEKMFQAYKKGYIEKIGFVKKDPAIFFKEQGVNAFFVMNRPPEFKENKHLLNKQFPQIGIWGSHMWHRNLLNQTVSALMIKNSTAHLNELPEYFFLDEKRLKRYGILSHEKYLPILESMDINLYISFTDCFPMTIIESMSYGIPCLASDTSEVYSWSDYLKNNLLISKIDSPIAIKNRIVWLLDNYQEVQTEIENYLPILRSKIEESIEEFLK